MKKPLYLSEIIYFILSIGNIIQLLLLQNLPIITIVLILIAVGILIINLAIKIYYYSTDDSSIILLMLNTITIIIRIIAMANIQQIIYQTDIFFDCFTFSSYNQIFILNYTKLKSQVQIYLSNYLYNSLSLIGFEFLQNYIIYNNLSSNDLKQVKQPIIIIIETILINCQKLQEKYLNNLTLGIIIKITQIWAIYFNFFFEKIILQKSIKPNYNQLPNDLNIKCISSQPNMHIQFDSLIKEDTFENLKKVQDLFHLPYLITDKDAKPIQYNSYFMNAFEISDQKHIQYRIQNMKIYRLDKKSQKVVKKVFIEKQINNNFYLSSLSQPNINQMLSISSQPIKLHLIHVLQIMDAQNCQCSVIDFQSEFLRNVYQIDIKLIQGYFLFIFTQTQERDDYKNKINTKLLMNQLFRSLSHEFSTSLNCIQILAENAAEELQETIVQKYCQVEKFEDIFFFNIQF